MPTNVTDPFGNTFPTCSISTAVKAKMPKEKYKSEAEWSQQVKLSAFHTLRTKIKTGEIKPGTIIGRAGDKKLVYKSEDALELRTTNLAGELVTIPHKLDNFENQPLFNFNDWDFGPNLVNLSKPGKSVPNLGQMEAHLEEIGKGGLAKPGDLLGESSEGHKIYYKKSDHPYDQFTVETPVGTKKDLYLDELEEELPLKVEYTAFTPAAPAAGLPVASTSKSVGALTNEEAATLFVKTKDKLATEKGINIKGANPELDDLVYKTIGDQAGYTPAEMKAKVEAYKDSGKKLSALKKKVLPKTGNPTKAPTQKAVDNAATAVKKETPLPEVVPQVWSSPDVATAYVKAKDALVANNAQGWTLYTKNPAFDKAIHQAVQADIGPIAFDTMNTAIADYIANHQKLSVLKKQLIKKGELKPQADTLKGDKKAAPGGEPVVKVAPKDTGNGQTGKATEDPKDASGVKPLTDVQKAEIKDYWEGANLPLSGSAEAILDNAKKLAKKYGYGDDVLPVLRWVDAYKTEKFGLPPSANKKLYEKKVVDHLKNPKPAGYTPPAYTPPPAASAGTIEPPYKWKNATTSQKNAQYSVGELPEDSSMFNPIDVEDMDKLAKATMGRFTAEQRAALKGYTGSLYNPMNGGLRQGKTLAEIPGGEAAQAAMKPLAEDIVVRRGTSPAGLGVSNVADIDGMVGKVFREPGFSSTGVGGGGFGGSVELVIQAPKGTKAAWLQPISSYKNEKELLLAAGTRFQVLRVDSVNAYEKRVIVRVVGVA